MGINKMIPKIFFKYSGIYDQTLYHFSTGKTSDANDPIFIERQKYVGDKKKEIEDWWNLENEKVLNKIAKVSGIDWKHTGIKIYLLAEPHRDTWMGGFSDPLTIFLRRKKDGKVKERSFVDIKRVIIHELVHQNIMVKEGYNPYISYVQNKFKCDRICAAHLVVHAILEKVYNKEELKCEMNCKHQPSYKKAWEIVKKIGANKIIEEFKEFKDEPNK